jgi:hypothetical protein
LRTRLFEGAGAKGAAALEVDAAGHLVVQCADGGRLRVLEWDVDGKTVDSERFRERFGPGPLRLEVRA